MINPKFSFDLFFEISQDMMFISQQNGTIIAMNPAGYRWLNLPTRGSTKNSLSIHSFLQDSKAWSCLQYHMTRQGAVPPTEIEFVRTDGSRFRTLISGKRERDLACDKDFFYILARDIEQKKLMEKQMAQTDNLASIGQLSAGIAHELNNPLGIILGYTQLLLRQERKGDQKYSDLKTIEKHVKNCQIVVKRLLDFARGAKPEKEQICIHDIIDEALNLVQTHAGTSQTVIVKDYDDLVPATHLDAEKIRQVFINLIMNARHAVGKTGTIGIETIFKQPSHQIQIRVKDTGSGIEKKYLSRIFDPFFTTKPPGEGTGLGLSVSFAIIKKHGGHIEVESEPGNGTIFTVTLPAD